MGSGQYIDFVGGTGTSPAAQPLPVRWDPRPILSKHSAFQPSVELRRSIAKRVPRSRPDAFHDLQKAAPPTVKIARLPASVFWTKAVLTPQHLSTPNIDMPKWVWHSVVPASTKPGELASQVPSAHWSP